MPAEGNPWLTQLLWELLPRLQAETDPEGSSFGTARAFGFYRERSVWIACGVFVCLVEIREINKPGTDCSCLKSLCRSVPAPGRSARGS